MKRKQSFTLLLLLLVVSGVVLVSLLFFVANAQNEEEAFWQNVITIDDDEAAAPEEEVFLTPASPAVAKQPEQKQAATTDETDFEESFEGVPLEDMDAKIKQAAKEEETKAEEKKTKLFRFPQQEHYYYEILAIWGLLIYGSVYYYGRKANEQVVKKWATTFSELFRRNFSSINIDPATGKTGMRLTKDSQSEFKFYATGRAHCHGLLASFELKKRHDLFTVIQSFLTPVYDKVTIDVPMNENEMEPVVFAIVRRSLETEFKKDRSDLSTFAKTVEQNVLPSELSVLAEFSELVHERKLITPEITAVLEKSLPYFEYLHVSDFYTPGPNKNNKSLRFVFRLPPVDQMEKLGGLMEMVIYYVELLVRVRLSPIAKSKALKRRKEIEDEHLEKEKKAKMEEAQQKKKQEQKQKQNTWEALEKEAQKKREEKERKKKEKRKAVVPPPIIKSKVALD
eukprot:GEZU01004096.1.p1 GENE.GEZU01004096.1~~GEZU01004096.1.p1  ORF type:complete len:453 (-),score=186.48 GEZU01004096.1:234-1592(-)